MKNICSKLRNVQLLGNMALKAFKVQKVSGSDPEVLQNFFQQCNQHWHSIPLIPLYSINSEIHVQLLDNMVPGAFNVQELSWNSPEALQNFLDSVLNIGLLPSLLHHINSALHV